ncbi:hypothetical protein PAXRUDRAFT_20247 [Paxillus rubicundulus Ve08.2h10]|uniref:Retrotransposon gag domain-containing protein n=1 Tax=Paxillus rubicundulus Ve08.2h10 TaxID=930991 RepID=A0A0D0D2E7_9AGAM|nr:hypothetical protein PAXRUDRAFT_20247 [Paxillus rubicundulus Ve08.2h10]
MTFKSPETLHFIIRIRQSPEFLLTAVSHLTSASRLLSASRLDPPGTPEQIIPDYLDFSPFVPGAFRHSTPPHAPKFLGKITAELPHFLEDVGILADQAQLDDAGKIRAAICYAALDEAELWETLDSATTDLAVWAYFVTAVKQLYPRCEGADRYYRSDLHNLVQEYQVKPMKNREELGKYHRKFQKVAVHLISMAKLSVNERDLLFLDGLPHALAAPV